MLLTTGRFLIVATLFFLLYFPRARATCLAAREELRREGLVDVEEVHIAQAEARLGEGRLTVVKQ